MNCSRKIFSKDEKKNFQLETNGISCLCNHEGQNNQFKPRKSVYSYEWSRLGPMGFFREPKLYPVKTRELPTTENYDLKEENTPKIETNSANPGIILPSAGILRRINDDRLRSTYQADFGYAEDNPWADYDSLMMSAGYLPSRPVEKPREEVPECRPPVKPPNIGGHEIPGRRRREVFLIPELGKSKRGSKRGSRVSESSNYSPRPSRIRQTVQKIHQRTPRISAGIDENRETGGRNLSGKIEAIDEHKLQQHNQSNSKNPLDNQEGPRPVDKHLSDNNEGVNPVRNNQNDSQARESIQKLENNGKSGGNDFQVRENSEKLENTGNSGGNNGGINQGQTSQDIQPRENKATLENNGEKSSGKFGKNDVKEIKPRPKRISINRPKPIRNFSVESRQAFLIDPTPWTSEYQEVICGTGDLIVRNKLHHYGKLRLLPGNMPPECL